MTNNNALAGGWTAFNFDLTADARQVFEGATKQLLGVKYTALAFATQVVSGKNYSFLAKGQLVTPEATTTVVKIHVYLPNDGEHYVVHVIPVTP